MHFTCLTFLLLYPEKKCGKCRDELVWRGGLCKACDENAKRKCCGCGALQVEGAYHSMEWRKPTPRCRACEENLEKKCIGCDGMKKKGAYSSKEWRKPAPRCRACLGEYLFSLDFIFMQSLNLAFIQDGKRDERRECNSCRVNLLISQFKVGPWRDETSRICLLCEDASRFSELPLDEQQMLESAAEHFNSTPGSQQSDDFKRSLSEWGLSYSNWAGTYVE